MVIQIYITKDNATRITYQCSGDCGYDNQKKGAMYCKHALLQGGGHLPILCGCEQHRKESLKKLKLELLYEEAS